jgi:hypothetical protein
MLEKCYLMAFDAQGIQDLLKPAAELPEKVRKAVSHQSGGHPFLGQYLLHHLWEEDLAKASVKDIDRLITMFFMQEIGTINGWVSALGPLAIKVYKAIGKNNGFLEEFEILRDLGESGEKVKNSLIALTCHGVIHHEGWYRYRLGSRIFHTWVDQL